MTNSAASLRSVVALVDRFPVLAGADLEVEAGQLVALTGPNGAGKTSLMRLLAGLIPVHDGSGEVLGLDLRTQRSQVRRNVCLIGHDSFLYDDLTVAENLAFVAAASGLKLNPSQLWERCGELLADERLMSVPVVRLSAGQRRRAELTQLLVRRPPLWLLDEPHSGLDAQSRLVLDRHLQGAVAEGATVIFSSHDTHTVDRLAKRRIKVVGGMIKEDVHVG